MKNITSLFFVLLTLCGNAQKDSSSCHTIVLLNGREISATIDSTASGFLFYHKCPDTIGHQVTISLRAVYLIQEPASKQGSLPPQMDSLLKMRDAESNEHVKRWMFKHKHKKKIRYISEGQFVKVFYQNEKNTKQKVEGKWKNMTKDFLVLTTRKGEEQSILKQRVIKVKITSTESKEKKKDNTGFGIILLFIGLGFSYLALFAGILAGYSDPLFIGTSLLAILMLILGLRIIIPTQLGSVKYPFGDDWEIVLPFADEESNEHIYQP